MSSKAQLKLAVPTLIEPTAEYREYRRMSIHPSQAAFWLEKFNQKNCTRSELSEIKYGLDMLEGRWRYVHGSILFGTDGQLIDGQTRLGACAQAGVPFFCDVYFGCDPNDRYVIDIQRAKTTAHFLELMELGGTSQPNTKERASIAAMLSIVARHGMAKLFDPNFNCSKPAVLSDLKTGRFPLIESAAKVAKAMGRKCRGSLAGFCWYKFAEQDRALADRFFEELRTGLNLSEENSVYWLRNRLESNRNGKAKLPVRQICALFFKAWIFYRDGLKCKNLRWRTDGPTPEQFPDIGMAGIPRSHQKVS